MVGVGCVFVKKLLVCDELVVLGIGWMDGVFFDWFSVDWIFVCISGV